MDGQLTIHRSSQPLRASLERFFGLEGVMELVCKNELFHKKSQQGAPFVVQ